MAAAAATMADPHIFISMERPEAAAPLTARAATAGAALAPGAGEASGPTDAPVPALAATTGSMGSTGMRKKTVPMPKSLVELKQAASQHFDPMSRAARLRLFHKGREIHHAVALADLQDGDEVVVRLARDGAISGLQQAGDRFMSTAKASYVKHPLRPKTPPAMNDDTSTLSQMQKPLEGLSSYARDYVKHPPMPHSARCAPGQTAYARHFLAHSPDGDGRSEYNQTFVWHKQKPVGPSLKDGDSVLSAAARGHPFTARSCYKDHYADRGHGPADPPTQALGSDCASVLTDMQRMQAFKGLSQYESAYVKHTDDGRQPSAKPKRNYDNNSNFKGDSEYQRQYMKFSHRAPLVHLVHDGE